ncbi:DUF4126 domain-containing protein [Kineosporia succinea]|uniref:Uncharacterized membrane protein (DUF485 family) n=1 Tax=Kineosporia succinea TaxID=84632 RepID=A0ABT9NXB4_9ACTN|nr:DUF4126 domain-containing protein [Kineosporia succinea]MDP9825072.1 uncharacterized membrane protein (DUF485 family) [Kineosporia succinea]
MIAALTGSGLAAAAGLNAWIPFVLVAMIARFTELIDLPSDYDWVTSEWALGVGVLLLLTEIVVDKVPVVDHVNDLVQTAVRPTVGGLISSATFSAQNLDNSQWMRDNPWAGAIIGVAVAGLTHATKSAARPVINVGTAGFGAPVASTIEDVLSVVVSVLAIFAPIVILVVLVIMAWVMVRIWRRWAAWRARRQSPGLPKTQELPTG